MASVNGVMASGGRAETRMKGMPRATTWRVAARCAGYAVFAVEQGAVNVAEDGAVGHGVLLWVLEQFSERFAKERGAPAGEQRAGRVGFGDVIFKDAGGGEHVGMDVERGSGVCGISAELFVVLALGGRDGAGWLVARGAGYCR